MKRTFACVAGWLLLATACRPTPEPESASTAPTAAPAPSSESAPADSDLGAKLPPLEKEDVVLGSGPEVKRGDRVLVHYTGTLLDGTKFDSSLDRGTAFEFAIGAGMVIPGWDLGVTGMKKGGKRKLTIPPHLAYDAQGVPPKIPPNATLKFNIELLEIL